MMLFNALSLMSVNAYLMPDENGEHLVYADTRILDPRYARSAEPLVCAHHEERFNPIISSGGGGGRGSGQVRQEEVQMIPIGCCPANDPTGKPYGAGKACCCGKSTFFIFTFFPPHIEPQRLISHLSRNRL